MSDAARPPRRDDGRPGGSRGQGGPAGSGRPTGRRPEGGRPGGGRPGADRGGERAPMGARLRHVDPPRQVAYEVLREVHGKDAYANLVLPGLLRQRRLVGRDAAFATELTYGTLRMLGLYDAVLAVLVDRPLAALDPGTLDLLRLGTHQLLNMRVPDHAAVAATVGIARAELGAGSSGLINAVLRRVAEKDLATWLAEVAPETEDAPSDTVLSVRYSHPEWIVRALRQSLVADGRVAGEVVDLLEADNAPADVSLLARPGLLEIADLLADGGTPGRWSPYAVTMSAGSPGGLGAVRDSRARVQDEGSQLVALALAAVPRTDGGTVSGERWLDLCAGPGGKSALLSALAQRDGATGTAVEVSAHRSALVEQSVRGAERVWRVRTADGRSVGEEEPGAYDRVLVDAPCTGLGALRRRPEARWRRVPSDLSGLAPLQRDLLASALHACRPGGVVAYVVCSPHVAETTVVIEDALKRAGREGVPAELLDAREALATGAGREVAELGDGPTVQLWPHVHGTDAMFLALLRRR